MRMAVLLLVTFGAGLGAARATSTLPLHEPPAPSGAPSDCAGGAESPLQIAIVPQRIDRRDGAEALTAEVRLRHRGQGVAQVQSEVEIVSDVGERVLRMRGPSGAVGPGRALPPGLLRAPSRMADGFYMARVNAQVQDEDGEVSDLAHLYFRVERGSVEPMEADDWYARSRINEGVAQ